uniref:Uncharacterized protein n=2 Tax=Tetradesmus obliquus TaxID=3088 RepID=A0A383WNX4_TETOB|eukprot:jgi/Sobl393_1/19299/SZX79145.1
MDDGMSVHFADSAGGASLALTAGASQSRQVQSAELPVPAAFAEVAEANEETKSVNRLDIYKAIGVGGAVSVLAGVLAHEWFGGARATPEQVALVLNGYGPVCVSGDGDAAAEAAAAQEQTADTAAGGTAGAEQHRAPSQSGDGSAGSIDATGERQAPGSRAPSAAAERRQPGWQASMDGSMQCSGGGMPSAPGWVTPGGAQPAGRLSIASVGDGSMAVRGAQEADGGR